MLKWKREYDWYFSDFDEQRFAIEKDGCGEWVLYDRHNHESFKGFVKTVRLLKEAKAEAERILAGGEYTDNINYDTLKPAMDRNMDVFTKGVWW